MTHIIIYSNILSYLDGPKLGGPITWVGLGQEAQLLVDG